MNLDTMNLDTMNLATGTQIVPTATLASCPSVAKAALLGNTSGTTKVVPFPVRRLRQPALGILIP
jgi:hypothetical protein